MIDITEHILGTLTTFEREAAFEAGVQHAEHGSHRDQYELAKLKHRNVREAYGFKRADADVLTAPTDNDKLAKGVVPAYGWTGQSAYTKLADGTWVNACPNAGHCTKVCVLHNGNGAYPRVQRARDYRTDFAVNETASWLFLLGYELKRAVIKHGNILFRPNVNTDLEWHRILPSLADGGMGGRIMSYGYTKRPDVLSVPGGWHGPHFRESCSWNENSDPFTVRYFMHGGGAVAMVTSRAKGDPVDRDAILRFLCDVGCDVPVIDADLTDEWMLSRSTAVIGDLSAKGSARSLIGKSGFVVNLKVASETVTPVRLLLSV